MPDLPIIKEKTPEGMMIQTRTERINFVPDENATPGYAIRYRGHVAKVNPEIFRRLKEAKNQEELMLIIKDLKTSYGSNVNGRYVSGNPNIRLADKYTIRLGIKIPASFIEHIRTMAKKGYNREDLIKRYKDLKERNDLREDVPKAFKHGKGKEVIWFCSNITDEEFEEMATISRTWRIEDYSPIKKYMPFIKTKKYRKQKYL